MNIKLNWLRLKNFKGLRDFKFVANGKNVFIFADNGKGKTTLEDGFKWLLFDKNSEDKTTFTIKPQDENGNDIHNLQTEVEAELLVDGKLLKLKKMQEEKWTTKRGSDTAELTGNTISYWYDEVPVKAGEYKQKISNLIDENIFKMITNPLYFNTKLTWQERRKILLEICGDKTDEEVIASDKKLSKLSGILNGRSIDDYKKVLADKLKGLKKEKADIPPRIDELTLSLPQETLDYSAVEAELKAHKETLNGIELLQTNATQKANEISKKYQELSKLNAQLEEIKQRISSEANKDRRKLLEDKADLEEGKFTLETSIRNLKALIDRNNETITSNAKAREQLVETWRKLNAEKQEYLKETFKEPSSESFVCPTCGQDLPLDNIETKIAEMQKNFEESKEKKIVNVDKWLEENKTKGLSVKAETERLQSEIKEAEVELEAKTKSLENIKTQISKIEGEINKPLAEPDYSQDAEYQTITNKIDKLKAELNKPTEDKSSELIQKKAEIQAKINECNKILNNRDTVAKNKQRIEELKADEKRISTLIAELEGHEYLLEQFVVSKVNLLEDSINSRFKFVKFKMFNQQVNGGIAETCEALVNTNGCYVPFADANSAGRINAGIDCLNFLCKFYGVIAPLWIDNRESVVRLADTDSQIISLVVSEKDKTLRVETEEC